MGSHWECISGLLHSIVCTCPLQIVSQNMYSMVTKMHTTWQTLVMRQPLMTQAPTHIEVIPYTIDSE